MRGSLATEGRNNKPAVDFQQIAENWLRVGKDFCELFQKLTIKLSSTVSEK